MEATMAARPIWRGQVRIGLVSIPVEIYSATKSGATVAFNQIHKPSGQRIKYEKVVPGIGPVNPEEIVKGYQYEKGSYVLLEEDELDAVKLESKKTLELSQFVDADQIDMIYFEKPYYVVPADDLAEEAFVVLREALKRTGKLGIGQLAMRGREYIVTVKPCGRGLVLETLRYADEVNRANSYFREIGDHEPDEELLELAETLIEKKTGEFDPSAFHDRYVDALHDLIERKKKAKGRKITAEEEPEPARGGNVIDLMAALKKSIERPGAAAGRERAPARKTARKEAAPKKRAAPKQETSKAAPKRKAARG
jgi:DNA end-binding protein Ku